MKLSKEQLRKIIKEELSAVAEAGDMGKDPAAEQAYALKNLMGALRAMGSNVTASNLETIQIQLDMLKQVVGDRDVPLRSSSMVEQ